MKTQRQFEQYAAADIRKPGPFANLGRQLQAVARAATVPDSGDLRRLDEVHRRSVPAGASEQALPDGGFLVGPEFSEQLIVRLFNTGEFLSRATMIPTTKPTSNGLNIPSFDEVSRADGSRFGGVQSYWEVEAQQPNATKPKFRLLNLTLHKLTAICYATNELLQDAAALEAAIAIAYVNELRFKTEWAALFGDGWVQPAGIMGSGALITVPKQPGQAAGTFVAANATDMFSRMWGPSRARAVWFVNQRLETQLQTLTLPIGSGGAEMPLYRFSESDDEPNRFMGRPVIPLEYMQPPGTPGDILFVDPAEFLFTQKDSIETAISLHVKFLTDEQAFRFTWRVDGQPMWHLPVTPATGGNTLSPYVALAAR